VFDMFNFYQRKKKIVLKVCFSNMSLRYFLSLWFLVKGVFDKYTLLIFQQYFFLCAFAKQTSNNFWKFWKNSEIILNLFVNTSCVFQPFHLIFGCKLILYDTDLILNISFFLQDFRKILKKNYYLKNTKIYFYLCAYDQILKKSHACIL